MFERLTQHAKNVLRMANEEAQRLNHEYIGSEHILMGMVRAEKADAGITLKELGLSLRSVRIETEKLVKGGPDMVRMQKLPLTPKAKGIVDAAIRLAQKDYPEGTKKEDVRVTSGHILLGILDLADTQGSYADQILLGLNLTFELIRAKVQEVVALPTSEMNIQLEPSLHDRVQAIRQKLGSITDFLTLKIAPLELGPFIRGTEPGASLDDILVVEQILERNSLFF